MKTKMTRQGVFAFWSTVLLLGGAASVLKDFNPQWKGYQKEFRQITYDRAKAEIERENEKVRVKYKDRLAEIEGKIRAATDASRSVNQQELIEAKKKEIAELEQTNYEEGQAISFAKSLMGANRSRYEFLRNDHYAKPDDIAAFQKLYEDNFALVQELTPRADKAYADLTKAKEELKALEKGPGDLVRVKEQIQAEQIEWEKKVASIAPQDIANYTANIVRDLPLLDFIDPKFNLKQVVLPDLPDLTQSAKVDRCQTCHLGIDNPAYADPKLPKVYQAHPNLDLYLGAGSSHPIEKFGCTTCHLGRGYGTTFNGAFHAPNDEEQEKEWKKKYNWKLNTHFWDYPMLPKKNMQAMCVTCHKTTHELTMAEDIFKGRQIYERRGCHGCHKIEGVSDINGKVDMPKVGPSLKRLSAKLDPNWTEKWVASPRDFYPSAKMPHPFGHQIPGKDQFPDFYKKLAHEMGAGSHEYKEAVEGLEHQREHMLKEDAVMIDSITAWLFANSEENFGAKLDDPPAAEGDPEKGKALVSKVNCLACHKVEQLNAEGQGYAPDLSKIGAKTNRKWLYNWVRDPKKYWPDTKMPNPRLTDEEANDVTAYLLTLKDEAYTSKPLEEKDAKILEEIAVRYKRAKLPEKDAVAEVAAMSHEDRRQYVGRESVYRRGCFGCHEIKGFETTPRIGAELTAEGFKELELFDFGMHKYVHSGHFRHDWIDLKVKQPYIFFLGKVMNPFEQNFYMPWFGFSEEEAAQITSYILGQSGRAVPPNYVYPPRDSKQEKREAVLAGRKIIERNNCAGCHPVGAGWHYVDKKEAMESKELLWLTRPLVGKADPNLPEGRFTSVAQVKEADIAEKDRVLVAPEGFISRTDLFKNGEEVFAFEDVFGEKPAEVNVGQKDEIRVPMDVPAHLAAFGKGEGFVAQFYESMGLAPPVLRKVGAKLYPEWTFNFLKKVHPVRNHIAPLRMPQWDWSDHDATAMTKFFAAEADEPFPYQTLQVADYGEQHKKAAEELFGLPGSKQYQASLKCLSCHPTGGIKPTSPPTQWGPDLFMIRERSKVEFLKSWLTNPSAWAPGTSMPKFFYDTEEGSLIKVRPNADEEIRLLSEMLYYFPLMDEAKFAAALALELQDLTPVKPEGAPAGEEFDEGGDGAAKPAAASEEFVEE